MRRMTAMNYETKPRRESKSFQMMLDSMLDGLSVVFPSELESILEVVPALFG